jgi:hypothetical protein
MGPGVVQIGKYLDKLVIDDCASGVNYRALDENVQLFCACEPSIPAKGMVI